MQKAKPAFLDTNIWIYAYSDTEKEKRDVVLKLLNEGRVCLSSQVLNEFIWVMNRKYRVDFDTLGKIGGKPMLHVVRAEYQHDYKIWVEFDEGSSGIADLSDVLWGTMFEPLKDIDKFRQFEVSPVFNTIVWQNGADLAPETLYEKAFRKAT